MIGLLLSDDLIFTSRVVGTGRDLGFTIAFAKTPEALLNLARKNVPTCIIVDLANPGLQIDEFIADLKQLSPAPTVVAYGSHVDTATLKAARAAGCDYVMPRSQFVEALPRDLAAWMKPAAG
jgi:CheY-like chemotaxis protein